MVALHLTSDHVFSLNSNVCLPKFSIKLSFIMKIIKQGGVSIEKSNMFYFMSAYFFSLSAVVIV